MHISYDAEADAAYITVATTIQAGEAVTQLHSIVTPGGSGEITIDFDEAGRLLGVEVLNASAVLAPGVLDEARRPDAS